MRYFCDPLPVFMLVISKGRNQNISTGSLDALHAPQISKVGQ